MDSTVTNSNSNSYAMDKPRGSIVDKAVCLSVELRRLGTRRRVGSNEIQTDADADMIHVSKEILESKALENIKRLDSEIRSYVNKRTVPGMSLFRSGVYLVPVNALEEIDAQLESFKAQRAAYVQRFLDDYERAAIDARRRLGSLYRDNDYPSMRTVEAAFGMDTRYVAFSTPDKLGSISAELYQREQKKMQTAIADATNEIRGLLRSAMADLVNHMVERLTVAPGEKPKIFRDSLVDNIRDFLTTFSTRNIVDDTELSALVDKAKSLLSGVDPQSLRDVDMTRESVAKGFTEIKAQLDTMITTRPTRKIDLDNLATD